VENQLQVQDFELLRLVVLMVGFATRFCRHGAKRFPNPMPSNPMTTSRRIHLYAAIFFWGMIVSYAWMSPRIYSYAKNGYADFSAFYTAGQILHRGQGHRLYDSALQTQVQREFSRAAVVRNAALPYLRAPFQALLFLPLAYVSYIRGYQIWVLLCGILMVVTALLLRARIPELQAFPWWIYYPSYFGFLPVAYGFALGQDCALMLLLIALFVVALQEGRDFRAGCFLGLALIKFQLVLPLVLILLLKKQFRVLGGFSVVAVALATISAWVVGWDGLLAYPSYLLRLNHVPAAAAIFPGMMPSLRGLVEGWMNPMHSSHVLDIFTAVLSLIVLVGAARQWDTSSPRDSKAYMAGIAVALLAALLAGYHAFSYDLSLLCPVVLLASEAALRDGQLDMSTRRLLLLGAAGLLFAPLYLLLIWKARLNLMAIFPLLLLWGYRKAIKVWQTQLEPRLP